ncbi:MAG: hypothetical protein AB2L07_13605 [Thermoanaerobaculaceae bacterium]
MDTDGVVWARVPGNDPAALEAVITQLRATTRRDSPLGVLAFDPAVHAFALVDRWGGQDYLPDWAATLDLAHAPELAALSGLVEEVVAFHTLDGGSLQGIYGHWKQGRLVRGLVWIDEHWAQAWGTPQAWEAPLFAPGHLAAAIEDAGPEDGAVREAYARGEVVAGEAHPRPGDYGHTLLGAMVQVLRAPRWGFSPWPPRSEVLKARRG